MGWKKVLYGYSFHHKLDISLVDITGVCLTFQGQASGDKLNAAFKSAGWLAGWLVGEPHLRKPLIKGRSSLDTCASVEEAYC